MSEPVRWSPYDSATVQLLGLSPEVAELLTGQGLPLDCHGVFVRDPERDLLPRDLPCGRAHFLGAAEDGYNTFWLVPATGEVWLARAVETPDAEVPAFALMNSSLAGLAAVLRLWEEHAGSGGGELDYDEYIDLVERAFQADAAAFADEGSWWSRVFEEVELDVADLL